MLDPNSPPKRRLAAVLPALACALLSLASAGGARATESSAEAEIKAAFLYNFAKFVQWPAAALGQTQAPLNVCLIGEDTFGPALDTIDRKVAQGHALQVRRRVRLEDIRSCHILFVAESERPQLTAILRAAVGASVLTVSEIDRFAEAGGVIGLYKVDNKLRFSVNLEQARAALLEINSQLLKLAKIVQRDGP